MVGMILVLLIIYWGCGFLLNAFFHPIETVKKIFKTFGYVMILGLILGMFV